MEKNLVVVTGMVEPGATADLWGSWRERGGPDFRAVVVLNGGPRAVSKDTADALYRLVAGRDHGLLVYYPDIMGVVPAFNYGTAVSGAYNPETIVALLHDDLRIDEPCWVEKVLDFFDTHPSCGLLGFGGALGVGRLGMYGEPFDPMTLARHDFMSNMQQAEAHGRRVTEPTRVAVLDGFSMIGRGILMMEALALLTTRKVIHHAYDVAFGALAKRRSWETWMLPLACHHHGGMSAVANPLFEEWASRYYGGGGAVWLHAHRQVWEEFRDILPFRVE